MQDLRCRKPALAELGELRPRQAAAALAASSQRAEPHALKRVAELPQAYVVSGDSVILTPAT